jgi:hypothetical protein
MIHLCTAWLDSRGGAARLIDSVRNQTLHDWRWYVSVDPKSQDAAGLEVLWKAAEEESRMMVVMQPVSTAPYVGAAKSDAARMIEATEGWCAWVDSDDWLDLDALETLKAHADMADAKWMITRVWEEYPGAPRGSRMTHPRMTLEMLMAHPAGLSHMEAFRIECLRHEPYDRQLTCGEDWDLHVRFWKRWGPPLFIPKAVYHYRMYLGHYDAALRDESFKRIRSKWEVPSGDHQ